MISRILTLILWVYPTCLWATSVSETFKTAAELLLNSQETDATQLLLSIKDSGLTSSQRNRLNTMIGVGYLRTKDYDQAITWLTKVQSTYLSPYREYLLAVAYKESHEYAKSSVLFQKLLLSHPPPPVIKHSLKALAESEIEMGNTDDALKHLNAYRMFIGKTPWSSDYAMRLLMAQTTLKAGMIQESTTQYTQLYKDTLPSSLKVDIKHILSQIRANHDVPALTPKDYFTRVENLVKRRRYSDALSLLASMKHRPSTQETIAYWTAVCHAHKRNYKLSLDIVEDLIHKSKKPEYYLLKANIELKKPNLQAHGLGTLQYIVRHFPHSPQAFEAITTLMLSAYEKLDFSGAKKYALMLTQTYPEADNFDRATLILIMSDYFKKNYAQVIRSANNYYKQVKTSTTKTALSYWSGKAYRHQCKDFLAKLSFGKIITDTPLNYYAVLAYRELQAIDPLNSKFGYITIAGITQRNPVSSRSSQISSDIITLLNHGIKYLTAELLDSLSPANGNHASSLNEKTLKRLIALYQQMGYYDRASISARAYISSLTGGTFAHPDRDILGAVFPSVYETEVNKHSNFHHIDPHLTWSVMRKESLYVKDAVSFLGAMGLLQLLPSTAQWMINKRGKKASLHTTKASLFDPEFNIQTGTQYLGYLLTMMENNLINALAAYHAGPSRVKRWLSKYTGYSTDEQLELFPIDITQQYVRDVISYYVAYRHLYTKEVFPIIAKSTGKETPQVVCTPD